MAEINKIKNRKAIEKINTTKVQFFKKGNKIDKALSRPTKGKKRKDSNY